MTTAPTLGVWPRWSTPLVGSGFYRDSNKPAGINLSSHYSFTLRSGLTQPAIFLPLRFFVQAAQN
jgi:hypothetical protein